eukprot:284996-Prorocentrum_minimum.AAC.3
MLHCVYGKPAKEINSVSTNERMPGIALLSTISSTLQTNWFCNPMDADRRSCLPGARSIPWYQREFVVFTVGIVI